MTAPFDFAPLLAPGTPAPAVKWNGFPKYNFIGGHNDAKHVPVEALIEAATTVLKKGSPPDRIHQEGSPSQRVEGW